MPHYVVDLLQEFLIFKSSWCLFVYTQETSVRYVVGRTLHGELLRDAPENLVDTKLFVLKDYGIVCHSFIFSGRDKSGANISGLSLIIPFSEFKSYLPFVELVEERVRILIAKLRVLQAKVLINNKNIKYRCK